MFSSPAAGVRRYVNALVPALRALGVRSNSWRSAVRWSHSRRHGARRRAVAPADQSGVDAVGLPIAARRAALDLIHAPAYTAPLDPRAGRPDDSRRQLRAASRVVSVSARPAAARVLSAQRAVGGARADRLRVLGRRDRRRVQIAPEPDYRGAAGCRGDVRADGEPRGWRGGAVRAARRRPARAAQPDGRADAVFALRSAAATPRLYPGPGGRRSGDRVGFAGSRATPRRRAMR